MTAARKTSEERRRQIADAAIKILGQSGLRELTAARLAREVGIKDGTIFSHFKDMDEVVRAMLDRLQELVEAGPQSAGAPLARLETFVLNRLRAVGVNPGVQSLLFSDQIPHALGAEGRQRVAALRNRGRTIIRSCLQQAAEQNLLRADLDLDAAVVLVTGTMMGFLFAAKDGALPAPLPEMEQRCWRTLRSALERQEVTS